MDIIVEPFRVGHTGAVLDLVVDALNPHYGGDHVAHFNRLVEAYLNDNVDERGYNSTRQVGLVASCARTGGVIGFLNYVVKRQNTVKISPLIVHPKARRRGVGRSLLAYLEKTLSDADIAVRNIYCTIDKSNRSAVNFFYPPRFPRRGVFARPVFESALRINSSTPRIATRLCIGYECWRYLVSSRRDRKTMGTTGQQSEVVCIQ